MCLAWATADVQLTAASARSQQFALDGSGTASTIQSAPLFYAPLGANSTMPHELLPRRPLTVTARGGFMHEFMDDCPKGTR